MTHTHAVAIIVIACLVFLSGYIMGHVQGTTVGKRIGWNKAILAMRKHGVMVALALTASILTGCSVLDNFMTPVVVQHACTRTNYDTVRITMGARTDTAHLVYKDCHWTVQ